MVRVVITGVGAVTPLGNTFLDSWNAVKAGISGVREVTKVSGSKIKWNSAGELKHFRADAYLGQKELRRLDPFVHYAVSAAAMSAEDAGLIQANSRTCRDEYLTSGGVIIGSSRGGIGTIEKALMNMRNYDLNAQGYRLSSYLMPATTISMAASSIAQKLGLNGHCLSLSNACASGSNAIGEAYRLLKAGFKGPVIAGGTDAPICRLCMEGYGISGALSKAEPHCASRPFDRQRDGFVLSEGACALVLENLEAALDARGKNVRRGHRLWQHCRCFPSDKAGYKRRNTRPAVRVG